MSDNFDIQRTGPTGSPAVGRNRVSPGRVKGAATLTIAALLAVLTVTGCTPTADTEWRVTGTGYSGPKIGKPGAKPGRHSVYCVPAKDYVDNDDVNEHAIPGVRVREVQVTKAVADTIQHGQRCPDGPVISED